MPRKHAKMPRGGFHGAFMSSASPGGYGSDGGQTQLIYKVHSLLGRYVVAKTPERPIQKINFQTDPLPSTW